jgi:pyridoxine 5-phosphate synthase
VRLGVNIDHVATLRQQRKGYFPDPVFAALTAQQHGADSIVAHLREDRRHIQDRDLRLLKEALHIPLAMEMAATPEMERIALDVMPARVCLVPEKRQELTTEGGLDVLSRRPDIAKMARRLAARSIGVSVFIDADPEQIRCAKDVGAEMVELHTGRYAEARGESARAKELQALSKAADLARRLKLTLHAGHGLDYDNVGSVAALPGLQELNIGFSIVSRALFVGFALAVSEMKTALQRPA